MSELKKLYVGNLPFSCNDEELSQAFGPYGEVLSAKVIRDRDTGRSKGFGFIEMNPKSADDAIQALNGKPFQGRSLTVNEARPREESSNKNYGGGGNNRGDRGDRDDRSDRNNRSGHGRGKYERT